ncbi:hypothetical protein A3Q56_08533, partial [Intoshia linei]
KSHYIKYKNICFFLVFQTVNDEFISLFTINGLNLVHSTNDQSIGTVHKYTIQNGFDYDNRNVIDPRF